METAPEPVVSLADARREREPAKERWEAVWDAYSALPRAEQARFDRCWQGARPAAALAQ